MGLQTLHENLPLSDANRPDEDFGFDSKMLRKESKKVKIQNPKKSDSKPPKHSTTTKTATIAKPSTVNKSGEKRLNLRKIDISAPIPITENQPPANTINPADRSQVLTEKNISSMKIEIQPVKKQKSNLANKVRYWTLKLSMKDRIAKEMTDQSNKEDE